MRKVLKVLGLLLLAASVVFAVIAGRNWIHPERADAVVLAVGTQSARKPACDTAD